MTVMNDVNFLHELRAEELAVVIDRCRAVFENNNLLEIGSGTGFQLSLLSEICASAQGIDVATGDYSGHQVFPVTLYDGVNIPFADRSFDVIFSSNLLEHIQHLSLFSNEMKRVLKDSGTCVHILPSHYWRFWTHITHYINLPALAVKYLGVKGSVSAKYQGINSSGEKNRLYGVSRLIKYIFIDPRHGERGNAITELLYFHPNHWRKRFRRDGWDVVDVFPNGLFYTGHLIFGERLSVPQRKWLSNIIGPSCYCYVLKKSA